jgi:hypothetical protein
MPGVITASRSGISSVFIYWKLLKKLNRNRLSEAIIHARHRDALLLPPPLAGWL